MILSSTTSSLYKSGTRVGLVPPLALLTTPRCVRSKMAAAKSVGDGPVIVYRVTHIASGRSYIGITTKTRAKRWKGHLADASGATARQGALQRAIKKYGSDAFSVETLYEAVNVAEAVRVERALIAAYGTMRPRGFNLTTGGEMRVGYRHSPESVERNRSARLGKKLTAQHREAISRGLTGHRRSAEECQRLSVARKGKPLSAAHRLSVSIGTKAAMARPDVRAKVDAAMGSEEVRARISAAKKAGWADPEFRQKTAEQRARFAAIGASLWEDPATRARMEAAAQSPERREKLRAAAKARWAKPEFRARMEGHMEKMTEAARIKNSSGRKK